MKKIYALSCFCLGFAAHLSAQRAADSWYFGTKAALQFDGTNTPVAVSTSEMSAGEGSASISDPVTGELLFYTDGISVWNRNNAVMPNGTDLAGGLSSTQAALIVPKPESTSEYYIFTTDQIGGSLGLRVSTVNMTLDGGLGNVTSKNVLLKTPVAEKIAAVEQPGSTNIWVLAHGWGNDEFYAFHVTSAGIDTAVVSNTGIVHATDVIQNSYGQLKFNPCGDRIALAAGYLDKVQLFDFDVITGMVDNPQTISYSDHVYGVEFSENSEALYVSTYEPSGTLVQYDLTITNVSDMIAAAEIVSVTADIYPLQRGADGKIYVCRSFSQYLGVIHEPNNIGAVACNYIDNGIDLDPGSMGFNSGLGLPNVVASFMGGTATCYVNTAGLESEEALQNLVFPNPSANDFTFEAGMHNAAIVITDVSGKQIASYAQVAAGESFRFGAEYAPGMYFVQASDERGRVWMMKVLKN